MAQVNHEINDLLSKYNESVAAASGNATAISSEERLRNLLLKKRRDDQMKMMAMKQETQSAPPIVPKIKPFSTRQSSSPEPKVIMGGLCTDMCPDEETKRRINENDLHRIETLLGKTIKKLQRSSADHDLQIPQFIRTPSTLLQTVIFIMENVMDLEVEGMASPLEVYTFIWDRFRMIAKDFILQTSGASGENDMGDSLTAAAKDASDPYAGIFMLLPQYNTPEYVEDLRTRLLSDLQCIYAHECMTRWYIRMDHYMCTDGEFRSQHKQQNGEQLFRLIKSLESFYERSRKNSAALQALAQSHPELSDLWDADRQLNEAEFASYFILYQLDNGKEVLVYIRGLPTHILHSRDVQFAIRVWKARKMDDHAEYFRLLRTEATYLQACIMFGYVANVRLVALRRMTRTYRHAKNEGHVSVKTLTYRFMFEDEEDCIDFVSYCGVDMDEVKLEEDGEPEIVVILAGQSIDDLLPRDKNGNSIPPVAKVMRAGIESKLVQSSKQMDMHSSSTEEDRDDEVYQLTNADICRGFSSYGPREMSEFIEPEPISRENDTEEDDMSDADELNVSMTTLPARPPLPKRSSAEELSAVRKPPALVPEKAVPQATGGKSLLWSDKESSVLSTNAPPLLPQPFRFASSDVFGGKEKLATAPPFSFTPPVISQPPVPTFPVERKEPAPAPALSVSFPAAAAPILPAWSFPSAPTAPPASVPAVTFTAPPVPTVPVPPAPVEVRSQDLPASTSAPTSWTFTSLAPAVTPAPLATPLLTEPQKEQKNPVNEFTFAPKETEVAAPAVSSEPISVPSVSVSIPLTIAVKDTVRPPSPSMPKPAPPSPIPSPVAPPSPVRPTLTQIYEQQEMKNRARIYYRYELLLVKRTSRQLRRALHQWRRLFAEWRRRCGIIRLAHAWTLWKALQQRRITCRNALFRKPSAKTYELSVLRQLFADVSGATAGEERKRKSGVDTMESSDLMDVEFVTEGLLHMHSDHAWETRVRKQKPSEFLWRMDREEVGGNLLSWRQQWNQSISVVSQLGSVLARNQYLWLETQRQGADPTMASPVFEIAYRTASKILSHAWRHRWSRDLCLKIVLCSSATYSREFERNIRPGTRSMPDEIGFHSSLTMNILRGLWCSPVLTQDDEISILGLHETSWTEDGATVRIAVVETTRSTEACSRVFDGSSVCLLIVSSNDLLGSDQHLRQVFGEQLRPLTSHHVPCALMLCQDHILSWNATSQQHTTTQHRLLTQQSPTYESDRSAVESCLIRLSRACGVSLSVSRACILDTVWHPRDMKNVSAVFKACEDSSLAALTELLSPALVLPDSIAWPCVAPVVSRVDMVAATLEVVRSVVWAEDLEAFREQLSISHLRCAWTVYLSSLAQELWDAFEFAKERLKHGLAALQRMQSVWKRFPLKEFEGRNNSLLWSDESVPDGKGSLHLPSNWFDCATIELQLRSLERALHAVAQLRSVFSEDNQVIDEQFWEMFLVAWEIRSSDDDWLRRVFMERSYALFSHENDDPIHSMKALNAWKRSLVQVIEHGLRNAVPSNQRVIYLPPSEKWDQLVKHWRGDPIINYWTDSLYAVNTSVELEESPTKDQVNLSVAEFPSMQDELAKGDALNRYLERVLGKTL